MLYKKTHRQHVRKYWIGRKFKYKEYGKESEVYKVTEKPYIGRRDIKVNVVDCSCMGEVKWNLVRLVGLLEGYTAEGKSKSRITWLD